MVSWPQWRWLEGRTDVGDANGCRLLLSHLWVLITSQRVLCVDSVGSELSKQMSSLAENLLGSWYTKP